VPKLVWDMITQSPLLMGVEEDEEDSGEEVVVGPRETTSKQPSLPATAEGWDVPMLRVKGGLEGYRPWIWFMSAGLRGTARARRRAVFAGRVGEMEWLCRLGGVS
jgi:hypothetical protein